MYISNYPQDQRMADERYSRWQGLAIAQLSVAVALVSGVSVSALATAVSFLKNKDFVPAGAFSATFVYSFPLLLLAAISSASAVVSRLLDFRLTARKVRKNEKKDYPRSLTIFWLDPETYGHFTWLFFCASYVALLAGIALIFISVWARYACRF